MMRRETTKPTDDVEAGELTAQLDLGLLARIRLLVDSLFPAERAVAEFVLKAPDQVLQLPIADLAERSGVSEGTVIRFCNTLGFHGYPALKLALAADLATPKAMLFEELTPADAGDPGLVAEKVIASDINALQETLKLVDRASLSAAVRAIEAASEITFFAVGSSAPVTLDAAGRFVRIGIRARCAADSHDQLVIASLLSPSAVAIAVSHSGATQEPVQCLALARGRHATTIALTARHPSPLTEHADIVLVTASAETLFREAALVSRTAQLSLLDSLYVAVALRRPQASAEALRAAGDATSDHRM
jgi:DNA-binding MurR/RpiR family transcriptional regulator